MKYSNNLVPRAPGFLDVIEEEKGICLSNKENQSSHRLNETSTLIWRMCDGETSLSNIVGKATVMYPNQNGIEFDVLNAIVSLTEQGLVIFSKEKVIPADLAADIDLMQTAARNQELVDTGITATEITANHLCKKLTIAMATYDDFDGTYFSIQSLRLHHPELIKDVEIIILDNNPLGLCGEPLRNLAAKIPNARYVPEVCRKGTSVRDALFELASSEFVLCMDCHVILEPGALQGLMTHFAENPNTNDLIQGPMLTDDLNYVHTHFEEKWNEGMYGVWGSDPRGQDKEGAAFEIPMQGLGLFACRTAAWPGFNPLFRGFGGEEGYIHTKIRAKGGKALCLPSLRWLHRFPRPLGVPYPLIWEDRIANYLIGFKELNLNTEPVIEHFTELLSKDTVDQSILMAESRKSVE